METTLTRGESRAEALVAGREGDREREVMIRYLEQVRVFFINKTQPPFSSLANNIQYSNSYRM